MSLLIWAILALFRFGARQGWRRCTPLQARLFTFRWWNGNGHVIVWGIWPFVVFGLSVKCKREMWTHCTCHCVCAALHFRPGRHWRLRPRANDKMANVRASMELPAHCLCLCCRSAKPYESMNSEQTQIQLHGSLYCKSIVVLVRCCCCTANVQQHLPICVQSFPCSIIDHINSNSLFNIFSKIRIDDHDFFCFVDFDVRCKSANKWQNHACNRRYIRALWWRAILPSLE